MGERIVTFDDNRHLRELVGEFGANLKVVSSAYGVDVSQRGNQIRVAPDSPDAARAVHLLEQLYELVAGGFPLHVSDVGHAVRILETDPGSSLRAYFAETVLIGTGGRPIAPRSPNQRGYLGALRANPIVFGVGPAGTGKTFLAMAVAVAALQKGTVRRIVLTRPAVEAGERLGFLPGDMVEKVNPYLRPLYDALHAMLPVDRVKALIAKEVIEVAPLAFMRGRTLSDSWVILDEAQNTTIEQMKMFLTRLGENSRMTITGDITQVDLPSGRRSGMAHALDVLARVERIGVVHFDRRDVVRHPLVGDVIEAYEADARRRRANGGIGGDR